MVQYDRALYLNIKVDHCDLSIFQGSVILPYILKTI